MKLPNFIDRNLQHSILRCDQFRSDCASVPECNCLCSLCLFVHVIGVGPLPCLQHDSSLFSEDISPTGFKLSCRVHFIILIFDLITRKQLDPLEAYVPAVLLAGVQIKELGDTRFPLSLISFLNVKNFKKISSIHAAISVFI
ncbi:hypothetical protein MTR67_035570 [Solanum verrucosum]|uniref:Uncharacterized protein n=1 Tax=Solanum verrucosum TaxID=315347 RepID=A0AAF0ZLP3_SOLVR|nr:hypothetical protein MTR67_035570 [Solanum verrucosum]